MNIRPKNTILFAQEGVKFSQNNLGGANWRQQVFNRYKQHLLEQLLKYGESQDYGQWLNEMQSRHAQLYNQAGNNFENTAYKNDTVKQYQHDYRGSERFGNTKLNPQDKYDFNQTGILPNQSTRYTINNPPLRTSGDFSRTGHNFDPDGLYSAITDDRRLLGRKGDWDEQALQEWNNELRRTGWKMELDNSDNYYKLKRLNASETSNLNNPVDTTRNGAINNRQNSTTNQIQNDVINRWRARHQEGGYGFNWSKVGEGLQNTLNNPDLWGIGRLAVNLGYNDKIYDEYLKGLNPTLRQSYHTYRQVFGDEATKQAYYRRAAKLQTKAAQPFTSNAETQLAAMFDAYDKGNELRAQGDLADNKMIRETSELANQHLDANRQRDTEVANANIAAMNQVNAQKHALLAQKLSAEGSSIDNFLQGIEYRKKQKNAEMDAINDQIFALDEQERLANDPDYLKAYNRWKTWTDSHKDSSGNVNVSHPDYLKEKKLFDAAVLQRSKRSLKRTHAYKNQGTTEFSNFVYGKSGIKITKKTKDDLLYKSVKDVVEHFRKMIELDKKSSKSNNKIERLAPHPKGTKKYQTGGVAPFLVYKPIALGGQTSTTTTTETSSSSKSSKSSSDSLDLMKKLFEQLQVEGLPSDTNVIYSAMNNLMQQRNLFGTEISIEDLSTMFISQMSKINMIKFNKAQYDKIQQMVHNKEADSEVAITPDGRIAVQNVDTMKIEYKRYSDINPKKHIILNNFQLLNMRAYSPNMAFDSGMALMTAANATSMKEVSKFLKEQLPAIESSESTIKGYTKKDIADIKSGIRALLQDAPEGSYEFQLENKTNKAQIGKALEYLYAVLPDNMKTLIKIKSGGDAANLIATLLGSKEFIDTKTSVDAATGRAAKNADGSNKESSENDMIPAIAFFNGMGEKDTFIIQDKTKAGLKIDTISTPITSKGYNTGSITFDKLEASDFGGQLIMNQATMGDSQISSVGRQNIIIDSRIYQTELPIDKQAKANGIIKPDLKFLKNIETANAKLRQMGIDKSDPKNIPTVNKVYQDNNLPVMYTMQGNKPVITSEYARFAIVNGIGTEEAFGENPEFNDGIQEISSDKEREQFESMMKQQSGNEKYKLDNGYSLFGFGSWGETKLYKGVIYIPMVTSNISALAGTGYKAKGDEYNEIEAKQQAADAAREMGFKPAGDVSNLK